MSTAARRAFIILALAVLTTVAYAPVRHFDFVQLDDPAYVLENPVVSRGLTLDGLRWAFTTGHAANWHPVTWLSHMVDVQLFGLAAGPHHLVNLALHLLNAILRLRDPILTLEILNPFQEKDFAEGNRFIGEPRRSWRC